MAVTIQALDNVVGGAWDAASSGETPCIGGAVSGETITAAPDASLSGTGAPG